MSRIRIRIRVDVPVALAWVIRSRSRIRIRIRVDMPVALAWVIRSRIRIRIRIRVRIRISRSAGLGLVGAPRTYGYGPRPGTEPTPSNYSRNVFRTDETNNPPRSC
jgi:hypothetical protein